MADEQPVKKNKTRRIGKPENLTNAGKGRPPGSLNKTTTLLKDAILQAATQAGGPGGMAAYLTTQAAENPGPFMALLGKVLPMQVTGEGGGDLTIKVITGVARADD